MSTRRSGRSRSQSRSRRDEEEAGSEPAPAPSPARLAGSESESEFEESQEADERVLERAEELEKIKEQQRETREGLAALRQRFDVASHLSANHHIVTDLAMNNRS